MKSGKGKKSSSLDDIRPSSWLPEFTTELLQLLWVLEATLTDYPKQAKMLDELLSGALFQADELPPAPESARKPPMAQARGLFDDHDDDP